MERIVFDLTLGIIIIAVIFYLLAVKVFVKVGKKVDKQVTKVQQEIEADNYEELEKKHLGDSEKQTGIYHPDATASSNESTKQIINQQIRRF